MTDNPSNRRSLGDDIRLHQGSAGSPPKISRRRVIRIEPSPGTIIFLLLLVAGIWVLTRLLPVVLVLVAALTIVGTISPAVRWLEERRLRRGIGIAIVFTALVVVAILIITLTIPSLMAQATTLLDQEPALRGRLAKWLAGSHLTNPLAELLLNVESGDLVRMPAEQAAAIAVEITTDHQKVESSLHPKTDESGSEEKGKTPNQ